MMSWKQHLAAQFKKGKAKNSSYTYTQAMKDAAKTYKKKGSH